MKVETVRWNIKVSKDTDVTLRAHLRARGAKPGDRSKFIAEAVRRRVLQCTVQEIWARNADANPDEIQRNADQVVSEVLAERADESTPK